MQFSITAKGFPELKALLGSQLKLARINVVEALNRTAESIVSILAAATPGGPDGPVASAWTYDSAFLDGGTIKIRIYNPKMTEDGKHNIAAMLEYGTEPHIILPVNKKALAFPAGNSSHAWEGAVHTGNATQISPVTLKPRASTFSPSRYGNTVLSRGEYHQAVASGIANGKLQFRSAKTGKMIRPTGSKDLVVVKSVHHPGTRPQFIVRSRIGTFQVILQDNSAMALTLLAQRTDFREA